MTTEHGVAARVALVTGASRGIGLAVATRLARDGYTVVGCARDLSAQRAAFASLPGEPGLAGRPPSDGAALAGRLHARAVDVADEASVGALFASIDRDFGRLDAVVNNAGVFDRAPVVELSAERFDRVMAVNVRGVFLCCREAFRRMSAQPGGGDIVNVSSLAGVPGVEKFVGTSAYVASKYAVAGLTEQLAAEGRPLGVRVKAVSPGAVATELLAGAHHDLKAGMTPSQLAAIIAFLLSDEGRPLGGSNVPIFSNA